MAAPPRIPSPPRRRRAQPVTWAQVRHPVIMVLFLLALVLSMVWQQALAQFSTRDSLLATGALAAFGTVVVVVALRADARRRG